ncbi:zinc-ribbon domain-containing protein [Clostridium sp.]|uniref:zinc-ribbon domain-containing protein n=1 Tax=Clostridium sp. TaxID=1506 RepID=UPI001A41D9C6|nr:zinc-ribbon domain-containing protein [Clostridium sp.]
MAITNPELSSEWQYDKNFPLSPFNITRGTQKKVWWKCHVCNNEWESLISNRSKGKGCPNCNRSKRSKNKRMVGFYRK